MALAGLEMTDVKPVLKSAFQYRRQKDFDATIRKPLSAPRRRCKISVGDAESSLMVSATRQRRRRTDLRRSGHPIIPVLARTCQRVTWRRSEGGSRVLIGSSLPTREAVGSALVPHLPCRRICGADSRPMTRFGGGRYAVVADPAGNDVGLMSPIDSAGSGNWSPTNPPSP